ncbi:CsiV family protein [Thalassotalea sediminis]|uniref:CsiV family protein n=1 Tax=Thalassotalea sediminis TaxID=1759089 RepID=UPI002572D0BA|nr:CsiV family protein [Thalassotalea sediminis]
MKFKQGLALLSSFFMASSMAASSRWSGDWFEIEVILMSNIADKSVLKEVFANQPALPTYKQSRDLLSEYLAPDVSDLKRLLPQCYVTTPKLTDITRFQTVKVPQVTALSTTFVNAVASHFSSLTKAELAQQAIDNETTIADDQLTGQESQQAKSPQEEQVVDDFFDRVKTIKEGATLNSNEAEKPLSVEQSPQPETVEHKSTIRQQILSDEGRELLKNVAEHTNKYADTDFHIDDILSDPLCALTSTQFDALSLPSALYSYASFAVDAIPTKIDGRENLYSQAPYLISNESLALDDIVTQLKRSRDFKPLLHIGWRQQVFEQHKAIPMRLYAGENLQLHYQQALIQYQQEKQAELDAEQQLQSVLGSALNANEQTPAMQKQQAKALRKQQILSTLANFDNNQTPTQLNKPAEPLIYGEQLSIDQAPQPPLQPWYLDGFLNVYLIGNYLNVKADLSIINLTLAEQASLALTPGASWELMPIRLEQKRRLISKEIHYFDHPYMGMIVQIRRHDRPKPELLAN